MAKGIVIGTPTTTHGTVSLTENLENAYNLKVGAPLTFANPDKLPIKEGDTLGIDIESTTTCRVKRIL